MTDIRGDRQAAGSRPRRIAIVEDEFLVAQDIGQILSRMGHQVVGVAATAEDGYRLICDGDPDLVFVDINLRSTANGLDLAQRIHGVSRAQVVFLTGQDDMATRSRASELDPLAFLIKPWSQARLGAVLRLAERGREGAGGNFVEVPRPVLPFLDRIRPADRAALPGTRAFLAYCAECSASGGLPTRAAIDPARIGPLLANLFILEPAEGHDWIVRVMGTGLTVHAEVDLTGRRLLGRLDRSARVVVARWCRAALATTGPRVFRADYSGHQPSYERPTPELVVTPMVGRDDRSRWLFGGIFLN